MKKNKHFRKIPFYTLCIFALLFWIVVFNLLLTFYFPTKSTTEYDLFSPYYSYFDSGHYQMEPETNFPFLTLLEVRNKGDANDNVILFGKVSEYKVIDEILYVKGEGEGEGEGNSEQYMYINLVTGEMEYYSSLHDIPNGELTLFESKISDECLLRRRCFTDSFNKESFLMHMIRSLRMLIAELN